jgi:hypothetical protein
MAITLLGCNCPCTDSENPCDCCGCITSVKIYSNISLNISGSGNSVNIVESGASQRSIDYSFTFTNQINSLIDIPNSTSGSAVTCTNCQGSGFSGDASQEGGFASIDYAYLQIWELAAGTECYAVVGPCIGSSYPLLEFGSCPKDVCLDGQIYHYSSTAGGAGSTDFQESNCSYNDGSGGDLDHITQYYCSIDNTFNPDSSVFSATFNKCPSSSLFNLSISYLPGGETNFELSTSPIGTQLGYVQINSSTAHIPLYIAFSGPAGLSSKSISGTAIIGIEFDYNVVTRNPETGECPLV